jgi:hypothetical protein
MNAITLRSRLFHDLDEVVAHDGLIVVAEFDHSVGVPVLDQVAPAPGEGVREHDRHQVLVDDGLRLEPKLRSPASSRAHSSRRAWPSWLSLTVGSSTSSPIRRSTAAAV